MILCFILVTHKNNTYCEPFLAKKVYLFSSICFFPKLFKSIVNCQLTIDLILDLR